VPLGTVARPVLEVLRPHHSRVELEALCPPTFDALVSRLRERPGHYHLVHFDGQGTFLGQPGGLVMRFRALPGKGHLVFEEPDGGPHIVNSKDLRQALAARAGAVFVLNACRSAETGTEPYASPCASQDLTGFLKPVRSARGWYPCSVS